jgi:hypothetical protein
MARAAVRGSAIEVHSRPADGAGIDPNTGSTALAALAQRALVVLRADGVAVGLRSAETVNCCATAGSLAPELGVPVDEKAGLTGECMRTRRMVACADISRDARVNASTATIGIGSVMVVPVVGGDVTLGFIEALWSKAHAFSDRDKRVLEDFTAELGEFLGQASLELSAPKPASSSPVPAQDDIPKFLDLDAGRADHARRKRWGIATAILSLAIVASVASIFSYHKTEPIPGPVPESSAAEQQLLDSLRKSAEEGNVGAQNAIASFYWTGHGVPQDNVTAYMWSIIAATHGDHNSKQRLEMLRTTMSRDSVNAAERRANAWLVQHRSEAK